MSVHRHILFVIIRIMTHLLLDNLLFFTKNFYLRHPYISILEIHFILNSGWKICFCLTVPSFIHSSAKGQYQCDQFFVNRSVL